MAQSYLPNPIPDIVQLKAEPVHLATLELVPPLSAVPAQTRLLCAHLLAIDNNKRVSSCISAAQVAREHVHLIHNVRLVLGIRHTGGLQLSLNFAIIFGLVQPTVAGESPLLAELWRVYYDLLEVPAVTETVAVVAYLDLAKVAYVGDLDVEDIGLAAFELVAVGLGVLEVVFARVVLVAIELDVDVGIGAGAALVRRDHCDIVGDGQGCESF